MYQNKFQATKIQNLLERSEKIPQTPDDSLSACCPIMSPLSSSLSLFPSPCHLHLLRTSLTPYEQLLIAEGSGAVAWSSWWWCWVPGCTCHHPRPCCQRMHPRSTPQAVARGHVVGAGLSWGVISVRWQVKEGWGAYLPYTGLRVLSPPIAVCSRSTPLVSSFVHHPGHGVPIFRVIPQVFSLKIN